MAIVTIDRPGVEVIQEFQTANPTILVPTLPACIMGPCYQVVEAIDDSGAFVSDSLITLPARIEFPWTSTPFEYSSIGTDDLELAVNGQAAATITFSTGPALDVDEVVAEITAAAISGLVAAVETSGSQKRVVLYTTNKSSNASIEIGSGTSADVLSAFGLTSGYVAQGSSGYDNSVALRMGVSGYPDPRSNLDELDIDFDTVRLFVNDGAGNIRELYRTQGFLQGANSSVSAVDDGDGDNLSPYLQLDDSSVRARPAVLTGGSDITGATYPDDFDGFSIQFSISGNTVLVTFSSPADEDDIRTQLNSGLGAYASASIDGDGQVVITSTATGHTAYIKILTGGTLDVAALGFSIGDYAAGSPSPARAQGTTDVTDLDWEDIQDNILKMSVNGGEFQTLVMPAVTKATELVDAINGLWGSVASLSDTYKAASEVWQIDDPAGTPGYVDVTSEASDFTGGDVDPWPTSEAIGDQLAIGYTNQFDKLFVRVTTAGVGGTLTWRYWNGSAWTAVSGLSDGSSGLTSSGVKTIAFTMPTDWEPLAINGGDSLYYLVAQVASTYSTNPVLGWAMIYGANLVLTAPGTYGGAETSLQIDTVASDSDLTDALGMTGGGAFGSLNYLLGNPHPVAVGDELWVDGLRLGTITGLVAGNYTRVRMDSEQLLSFTGSSWFINAMGLDNDAATASRPSSELQIDGAGGLQVRHHVFRDTGGRPTAAGPLATYLGYNALRLDVSPDGEGFNLLRYGSTTVLEADLAPLDTQNPLGLGMYLASLNAPGLEITGLGVGDASSTEPEGTLDAYVEAFEFVESKDVYTLVPLTHSQDVGLVAQAHVDAMSEPENSSERCVLLNPSRPTHGTSTLVASGATGNVNSAPGDVFQSGIANLQALLAAAGAPGPTYTESDGVYLELEDDTNKYLIQAVSGGAITLNDGPLSSSNDFFYDANNGNVFASVIVDRPFTVKIRGEAIANRTDEAVAYSDLARVYRDRRVVVTAPSQARATIDGLETLIEGYYLNAALAGRMSAVAPQQPLTESTLVGFTGVVGSNDRYSEYQLKIMSGGGLWVFYTEAGAVKTRQQLTSDMSSVEKREDSIRRALDFVAKFMRIGLRNFIGQFNITTNVQDAVSMTAEGLRSVLLKAGVVRDLDIVALRQSTSQPDMLEMDCDVTVLYPLNKIRMTLVI